MYVYSICLLLYIEVYRRKPLEYHIVYKHLYCSWPGEGQRMLDSVARKAKRPPQRMFPVGLKKQ